MEPRVEEQNILRQYLLGDLPAESRRSLEERLMTDEGFYEELLMAEDDLMDQYLDGTLTGLTREVFEGRFLAVSEGRRKLRFASALREYVAAAEQPEPEPEEAGPVPPARGRLLRLLFPERPALGWALAAALLMVAAAVLVTVRNLRGPEVAARVYTAELRPGSVRQSGDDMKRIAPPPDAAVVRLELESSSEAGPGYRAVLLGDDGRTLLSRDGLETRERDGTLYVPFDVPAELLTRGDYRVKLSRIAADGATPEDLASYSFRVAR